MTASPQELQNMWDKLDPPKKQKISFYPHLVFSHIQGGVKMYKEVTYIRKGYHDSKDTLSTLATDADKQEFATEYHKYIQIKENMGTPLSCLFTHAECKTLNDLGIINIEQLAEKESLPIFGEFIAKARKILEIKDDREEKSRKSDTNTSRQPQHIDNHNKSSQRVGGNGVQKESGKEAKSAKGHEVPQNRQSEHNNQAGVTWGSWSASVTL